MPRHTPPADLEVCDLCGAYVANKPQHVYWHSRITPVLDAHENDDAQTVTLPAVRDSIGPRRRPPQIVAELLEGAELTRLLLAELARAEADEADQ